MKVNEKSYPEPTVGGLILNDKKQIVLAKSRKWKDLFTIPGGHVELGETLEEALKREIKEETGLEIKPIRFLLLQEAIYSHEFYKRKHFIFLDYLCEAQTTDVEVDEDEIQDFVWVDPRKASEMDVDSFTKRTIQRYLETRE
jgi:nucleoside triphosphatase